MHLSGGCALCSDCSCSCVCRKKSNRHTEMLTAKGKKTSTRVSQALVAVTARHLSGHKTIARLIEKSALTRLGRMSKQGRKAKIVMKVCNQTDAAPVMETSGTSKEPMVHPKQAQRKSGQPKKLKVAKLAKNKKRMERVQRAIAGAKQRKEKGGK